MSTDAKIQEAIREAVTESGQSKGLADKLIAFFEAVANGNENLANRDFVSRHLDLLYENCSIDGEK